MALTMRGRFHNSLQIIKESFAVIKHHPTILIFPLCAGTLILIVLNMYAGILYGLYKAHYLDATVDFLKELPENQKAQPPLEALKQLIGISLSLHIISSIILTFCNVSLITHLVGLFTNRPLGVVASFGRSLSRLVTIVLWGCISSTIGLVLNIVSGGGQGGNFLQRLLGGFLDLAWHLMIFFVTPVLALKRLGIIGTVKESSRIMKQTFGKAVIGNFGFGLIGMLCMLVIAPLVGLLPGFLFGPIAGITVGVTTFFLCLVIITTAQTIFKTAVYQYAVQQPTGPFDQQLIRESFIRIPEGK